MTKFSFVLEDNLAEQLCNFKNRKKYNHKIVEHILHYYKSPVLLSKQYWSRYYPDELLKALIGSGNIYNQPLEELAKHTRYKLILSSDKNEFPYVKIYEDKIENNFTATFTKCEPREKAIQHIKALLLGAEDIYFYDKYISYNNKNKNKQPDKKTNWEYFLDFVKECFPKKELNIFYDSSIGIRQNHCLELGSKCKDWKISKSKSCNYAECHDRYLLIDKTIEIILTSGFAYLMDNSKDFTYIVRIKNSSNNKIDYAT